MKTVMITGGMDWTDAGADLLDVPESVNIEAAYEDYRLWWRSNNNSKDYLTFIEWLKANRGAVDSKAERFHEE